MYARNDRLPLDMAFEPLSHERNYERSLELELEMSRAKPVHEKSGLSQTNKGYASGGDTSTQNTLVAEVEDLEVSYGETKAIPPVIGKVSLWHTITYAIGSIGMFASNTCVSFFLTPFLLEVAGISPFMAGNLLLVGNIWDAVTDPIVGWLSDKTNFPRRKPWILFGMLPASFFYLLMWLVPSFLGGPTTLFFYYLVCYLVRTTAMTAFSVPYHSLGAELTSNYNERTKIAAFRWIFSLIGAICVIFTQSMLIEAFPKKDDPEEKNYEMGYGLAAIITATLVFISCLSVLIFVPENHAVNANPRSVGFFKGLKFLLSNKPFLIVASLFCLSYVSFGLITNNLFLYVKYVLFEEQFYQYGILLVMIGCTVALPFWAWVAARFGKKTAYYVGSMLMVVSVLPMAVLPEHSGWPLYFISFVSGFGLAVGFMIPGAMLPDVIDLDELRTGERREGAFFSMFYLTEKVGVALAISMSNYALGLSGYVSPDDQTESQRDRDYQPESARNTLRAMIGIVPSLLIFISTLIVFLYPINKKYHEEILAAVRKKKIEKAEAEEKEKEKDEEEQLTGSQDVSDPNTPQKFTF